MLPDKILQRIMYNHIQKYSKDQNILHAKQFGFQTDHSRDHFIADLVDQIYEPLKKGVLIDLSHTFLLSIIQYYK